MSLLLPLLISLLAAPLLAVLGRWRPAAVPHVAIGAAALAFATLVYAWIAGSAAVKLDWAPSLDLYLSFRLDTLAGLYGAIATGVGLLIALYSQAYIPHHLHTQKRPLRDQGAFYLWLILFMASMLGLVMADDLILLFVFFDLTALCSYFLIAFDRHQAESRHAALCALLVTGVTSVLMLIGIIMLYVEYNTFSVAELIARAEPGSTLSAALTLVAIAALAKSAQVPLHFWLPRAMAAPTPVSAYLHSAAMVAAGVFVLHRLHPLLELTTTLRTAMLVIALLSILIGGILAVTADDLKRILAYSTIAQYGYVTLMLSLGGATAATAAAYYVLVHALCKSALFMLAGAVETATGTRELERLGGLARPLPLLAVSGGVAAATLAGLPLTAGFFKDELLFKLTLEHAGWIRIAAVVAAATTLVYTWRLWSGLFLGPLQSEAKSVSSGLQFPIVTLAVLALLGGIIVDPAVQLAVSAGADLHASELELHAGYRFGLNATNAMALSAYAIALALLLSRRLWLNAASGVRRCGARLGPDRVYQRLLTWLNRLSDWFHDLEVRDLRDRLASVLIPAGLLIGADLILATGEPNYGVADFGEAEPHLIIVLIITTIVAVLAVRQQQHLGLILSMTGVGFGLALVFALLGAPDVALVAVLIETTLTLLFIATLTLLPDKLLRRESAKPQPLHGAWWHTVAGVTAGVLIFIVAWSTLSEPGAEVVAEGYRQLSLVAHANNIVAAILADFRGLDTLGEATVVFIALLAIINLLRLKRHPHE